MTPRKLKFSKKLRVPKRDFEMKFAKKGYKYIAGIDEVGRAPWAGPVVAAAVILSSKRIHKIRDSKLLNHEERRLLAQKIIKESISYSIYFSSHYQIDNLGIHQATILAFKKALRNLKSRTDMVLVDAFKIPRLNIPHLPIIKGDTNCYSIAAASIIAKVARDNYMIELSEVYPQYDWQNNKGYPSPKHKEALKKFGPSPFHRRSFAPIAKFYR